MTSPLPSEVVQDVISALTHTIFTQRAYRVTGTWGISGGPTVAVTLLVTDSEAVTHSIRIEVHLEDYLENEDAETA